MLTIRDAFTFLSVPYNLDVARDLGTYAARLHPEKFYREVVGQPWPVERAYPPEVIREVFSKHPYTSEAAKNASA